MFTGKKVVKGVIYDNPNIAEEEAYKVADDLSYVMDRYDEITESLDLSGCPNKNELLTTTVIRSIIHPDDITTNLIIPSSMIDERLYSSLKNIDIGEQIIQQFRGIRCDEYIDRNTVIEESPVEEIPNSKDNVRVFYNNKEVGTMDKNEVASCINQLLSLVG